jgi:hypothetical protein
MEATEMMQASVFLISDIKREVCMRVHVARSSKRHLQCGCGHFSIKTTTRVVSK